jgi:hypothetical protein
MWINGRAARFAKDFLPRCRFSLHMINSVSSANATNELTRQAGRQPQLPAHAPTGSAIPQDTVTLKGKNDLSAGDSDHDGK